MVGVTIPNLPNIRLYAPIPDASDVTKHPAYLYKYCYTYYYRKGCPRSWYRSRISRFILHLLSEMEEIYFLYDSSKFEYHRLTSMKDFLSPYFSNNSRYIPRSMWSVILQIPPWKWSLFWEKLVFMASKYLKEYMGLRNYPIDSQEIELLSLANNTLLDKGVDLNKVLPLAQATSSYLFRCQKIDNRAICWKRIQDNMIKILSIIEQYSILCSDLIDQRVEPPLFAEFCNFGNFRSILNMDEVDFRAYEDYVQVSEPSLIPMSECSNFTEDYDCNLCQNEFGLPDIYLDDIPTLEDTPEDLRELRLNVIAHERDLKMAESIFGMGEIPCPCTNMVEPIEVPEYRTTFLALMRGLKDHSLSADEYSQMFGIFSDQLLRGV